MEQSQESYPPPVYRNALEPERERSLRTLTHVLYALYAVHWLTGGLTIVIAIIINYVKRSDAAGTPKPILTGRSVRSGCACWAM